MWQIKKNALKKQSSTIKYSYIQTGKTKNDGK